MRAKQFECVSIQGDSAVLRDLILKEYPNQKSLFFDRGETILHQHYGDEFYWQARRSMRYSKDLIEIADRFREKALFSSDILDNTVLPSSWRDEVKRGPTRGGEFVCVHWRRRDFIRAHGKELPSIQGTARQLSVGMSQTQVRNSTLIGGTPIYELRVSVDTRVSHLPSHSLMHLFCLFIGFVGIIEAEIEMVQVLFRHGDRAPSNTYPLDPHKVEIWPRGLSQLTDLGYSQAQELGEYLHYRYMKQYKLLGKKYDRKKVRIIYYFSAKAVITKRCLLICLSGVGKSSVEQRAVDWRYADDVRVSIAPLATSEIDDDLRRNRFASSTHRGSSVLQNLREQILKEYIYPRLILTSAFIVCLLFHVFRDIRNKSVLKIKEHHQAGMQSPVRFLEHPDYLSETEMDEGRNRFFSIARPASAMAHSEFGPPKPIRQKRFDTTHDLYASDASSHDSRSVTRSGSATPIIDKESRARMETMERQLAGLSSLVHSALVSKGMSDTTRKDMDDLRREVGENTSG
uniref:GDP-fucose protein O-fucosyltransferase 2 n=1 Tax=Heterorhabditis bacteriophora TaxID=37862 RepID=A0A1I7XA99_HETBA